MFTKDNLNPKELAVMNRIINGKCTQLDIVRDEKFLGCLERYEGHLPIDKLETTLRMVRKIIRDLRFKDAPIISGSDGYFIPSTDEEVKEYIERLANTAKAQAKSHMVTYHQMVKVFGDAAKSDFFEDQQGSLFD